MLRGFCNCHPLHLRNFKLFQAAHGPALGEGEAMVTAVKVVNTLEEDEMDPHCTSPPGAAQAQPLGSSHSKFDGYNRQ